MTDLDCAHGDGLYADFKDCTRYIQCANDNPYRKRCPQGTYFSASSGTCGYDTIGCADGGLASKKNDIIKSNEDEENSVKDKGNVT